MSRTGEQRFRCHGCGASGSAIDLVMHVHGLDVRRAMDWLANLTSLRPEEAVERRWKPDPVAIEPHPDIESYVAACKQQLWHRSCVGPARWLVEERGLSEEVLRLNRVVCAPAYRHGTRDLRLFSRAAGAPRRLKRRPRACQLPSS